MQNKARLSLNALFVHCLYISVLQFTISELYCIVIVSVLCSLTVLYCIIVIFPDSGCMLRAIESRFTTDYMI